MADRYRGPATLDTGEIHVALDVQLTTFDDGLSYSWDGRGTTPDLRAHNVRTGTLIFPNGKSGPVHIPRADINPDGPGVLLRIHGGGKPSPYADDQ